MLPGSDYDIGLFAGDPISPRKLAKIRGDLEESNIPVTVDVVDFKKVSPAFKRVALKEVFIWNDPRKNFRNI